MSIGTYLGQVEIEKRYYKSLENTSSEHQKRCRNNPAFTKIFKISMFMFMYFYLTSDSPIHNHLLKWKSLYILHVVSKISTHGLLYIQTYSL